MGYDKVEGKITLKSFTNYLKNTPPEERVLEKFRDINFAKKKAVKSVFAEMSGSELARTVDKEVFKTWFAKEVDEGRTVKDHAEGEIVSLPLTAKTAGNAVRKAGILNQAAARFAAK